MPIKLINLLPRTVVLRRDDGTEEVFPPSGNDVALTTMPDNDFGEETWGLKGEDGHSSGRRMSVSHQRVSYGPNRLSTKPDEVSIVPVAVAAHAAASDSGANLVFPLEPEVYGDTLVIKRFGCFYWEGSMLTPKLVRAWLRTVISTEGPNAVVGVARQYDKCPLSNCLKDQPGVLDAAVYAHGYDYWVEYEGDPAFRREYDIHWRSWIAQFLKLVDTYDGEEDGPYHREVTALQALNYLNEVDPEYEDEDADVDA